MPLSRQPNEENLLSPDLIMLDPQYIRKNLDAVKANCKNRPETSTMIDRHEVHGNAKS